MIQDKSVQPSVKKYVRSATVNPDTVTNAVSNYIIQSMRPIAEVENKGFIDLLYTVAPSYNLPSRKTMRLKIVNSCQTVAQKIKTELAGVMLCAAQTDIWSSRRMHGFLGMCVSYIINGELRTRVIACDRFIGKHSAVLMGKCLA
jgi:hypothetical protein